MARSAKDSTLAAVAAAAANYNKAEAARRATRERLNAAMVKAVRAGNTRYAVAALANVTPTRVSQIPGMPKGKNATTPDVE